MSSNSEGRPDAPLAGAATEPLPAAVRARARRAFVVGAALAAAFLVLAFGYEQRRAAPREFAAELAAASEPVVAAAAAWAEAPSDRTDTGTLRAALEALSRHSGVARVTLLLPDAGAALSLQHGVEVLPRWTSPREVPRGQSWGEYGVRLCRPVTPRGGSEGALVVEGGVDLVHARRAEWSAVAARAVVALLVLALLLAPAAGAAAAVGLGRQTGPVAGAALGTGTDDRHAEPPTAQALPAWLERRTTGASVAPPAGGPDEVSRGRAGAGEESASSGAAAERDPAGALDHEVLGQLLADELGRELAVELIAGFLDAVPETVDGIGAALGDGDLEAVARLAHRFVSTSGAVGAMRLVELMREVERACRAGDGGRAADLAGRAASEVEVARAALERQLRAT